MKFEILFYFFFYVFLKVKFEILAELPQGEEALLFISDCFEPVSRTSKVLHVLICAEDLFCLS